MRLEIQGLVDYILHDVRYVPQFQRNLMYPIHIRKIGHSIHMFDGKVGICRTSDNVLVMTSVEALECLLHLILVLVI